MEGKLKKALVILIIIMAAVLARMLWEDAVGQKEQQRKAEKMEEELRPLDVEKNRLERELEQLAEEYELRISGTGTVGILFTDLDERIYTEIYPVMKEYGYTAVLAVSGSYLPGGEGRLSVEQITELLAAGWACCPTWQAGDSLQTVLDLETVLAGMGAAPSNTIYFEEGAYTQAYDTDLAAAGYTSVIHHGEENLPLVTSDTANPVWHPGAVGLQGEEPRFRLEDAVEGKGNIIFTVGYTREDEMYDPNPFISMLDYLQEYGARSEVSVMKPWEARSYFTDLLNGGGALSAEYEEKKAELEEQIEAVQEEMDSIRKEDGKF